MTTRSAADPRSTRVFDALGHRFLVDAPAVLAEHVDAAFSALRTTAPADQRYAIRQVPDDPSGTWTLTVGEQSLLRTTDPGAAYAHLCWHVNRAAIDACADRVLLHAAGAARPSGEAVLLPAASGSGKTTLVAGLLLDGFAYLSDEAVGIDPATGRALAFPKPLSIDRGSWSLLEELRPKGPPELEDFVRTQWQVAPGAVATTAQPAAIVSPQFVPGDRETCLEPLTKAETLVLLAESSFNLHRLGDGFDALGDLAESCPGFRLRHHDLRAALDAIEHLVGGAGS